MKKMVNLLGVGLVMCLLLTACGHEHAYGGWERDAHNHWKACECGEITEQAAHALGEDRYCYQCQAAVLADEDGSYSILRYDDQGNICSQIDYAADGTPVFEMRCETEYDENVNPEHQRTSYDGVLESEYFYQPTTLNQEAAVYVSKEILYNVDCKYISQYDEQWHLLSYTTCDLEDNVLSEDVYELEFDDRGNVIKTTCYTDGEISNISQDMLGPDGTMYNVSNIYYENGLVVHAMANQHEFDESGTLIGLREYVNDLLSHEIVYHGNADDGYYMAYEATYDENGILLWENRYDTEGNTIEG